MCLGGRSVGEVWFKGSVPFRNSGLLNTGKRRERSVRFAKRRVLLFQTRWKKTASSSFSCACVDTGCPPSPAPVSNDMKTIWTMLVDQTGADRRQLLVSLHFIYTFHKGTDLLNCDHERLQGCDKEKGEEGEGGVNLAKRAGPFTGFWF